MSRIKAAFYNALTESLDSPARAASAVGLGVFVGLSPAWGFHAALAFVLAHVLRLNKPLALAASMVSVPPLVPFIVFASLAAGRFLLGAEIPLPSATGGATLAFARENMAAWLAGSLALALLAGATAWLAAFAALKAKQTRNPASASPR